LVTRLGTFLAVPKPNPNVRRGTVCHTSSGEKLTIHAIYGSDWYPWDLGSFYFTWYQAFSALGQPVMVKLYYGHPAGELVFRHEQRMAGVLLFPTIARSIGQGRFEECAFSVFEYMPGGTLRHWLETNKHLTGADVISVARQVAEAIDFAHARGIRHYDIKPECIWLDPGPQGRVALAEFGIIRCESDLGDPEFPLPSGYPAYRAPEVYPGYQDTTDPAAVDIYNFGVVLYEMISGTTLLRREKKQLTFTPADVLSGARDIRTYRRNVSERLALRLAETLSLHPEVRPRTAAAVLAGVEDEIVNLRPCR
jgi:eukaryotic-like serine/threonine-protein kinase